MTIVCKKNGDNKTCKPSGSFWKRRIESDIARFRKELSCLDDWFKGKQKKR